MSYFGNFSDQWEIGRDLYQYIAYSGGERNWLKNGLLHREDGPALEWYDGDQCWYKDGVLHRVDGPAIVTLAKGVGWFVNNQNITDSVEEWMEEQNITWPFDEPTQMLFLMKFG